MARIFGKLSRLRHGAAHPDVGLVTDINALFCKKKETEQEEVKHFLGNHGGVFQGIDLREQVDTEEIRQDRIEQLEPIV